MKKQLLIVALLITTVLCSQAQVTLYGLASSGGANTGGTIFVYSSQDNSITGLYSFGKDTDGRSPYGSLVLTNSITAFGMTTYGGPQNTGTIFSFNIPYAVESHLYTFNESTNGTEPYGSLVAGPNGLLYGLTSTEGSGDAGSIFSYNINNGHENEAYDFADNNDGDDPVGSLMVANNKLLYGMTSDGGSTNNFNGEIFSIDTNNNYTILHSFANSTTDGSFPKGALIQAGNGLLYGLTDFGGANTSGTLFSFNIADSTVTDLWDFGADSDGREPQAALLQANDSLLYGTTILGGNNNEGILFSYNIKTGQENVLHNFGSTATDGTYPAGSLIQAGDDLLYGTTTNGGDSSKGAIFNYTISTKTTTIVASFKGSNGAYPFGSLTEAELEGINQLSINSKQLSVYPNPSNNFIHASIQLKQIEDLQLHLLNMLGQTMWSIDAGKVSSYQNGISVANLPDGVYLLEMVTRGGVEAQKIIVTH